MCYGALIAGPPVFWAPTSRSVLGCVYSLSDHCLSAGHVEPAILASDILYDFVAVLTLGTGDAVGVSFAKEYIFIDLL